MNENKILNYALQIMNDKGVADAYEYLENEKVLFEMISGQYYNFLYCLAAINDKKEEALGYIEEAIINQGLWYRTEVFEDEDLDSLRNSERFKRCFEISEERFKKASINTTTINTWNKKKSNKIVCALHGNQQNIEDSKRNWNFLQEVGFQVEYIQSEEIDSCGIFRWEDDGTGANQLNTEITKMDWEKYEENILCGFSSGCNTILKGILEYDIQCSTIMLQSPWIPVIDDNLDKITEKLKNLDINIYIVCGMEDEDCFDRSKKLYKALKDKDARVEKLWLERLDHQFPRDYEQIYQKFIIQDVKCV